VVSLLVGQFTMSLVTNGGVPDFSTAKGFGGYEEEDTAHLLQMAQLGHADVGGSDGAFDGPASFNAIESLGYEEEGGGADFNTFDASAFDAEAALLFGDDSGAPMGDPFLEMPDADLTKMSLGCDYPEAGTTPPPDTLNSEVDSSPKADSVCGASEATGTADNSCDLSMGEADASQNGENGCSVFTHCGAACGCGWRGGGWGAGGGGGGVGRDAEEGI
jgi:hypothetical protein